MCDLNDPADEDGGCRRVWELIEEREARISEKKEG
jgi:hypothetical protein